MAGLLGFGNALFAEAVAVKCSVVVDKENAMFVVIVEVLDHACQHGVHLVGEIVHLLATLFAQFAAFRRDFPVGPGHCRTLVGIGVPVLDVSSQIESEVGFGYF